MYVKATAVEKSKKKAKEAIEGIIEERRDKKYYAKVCCICDKFISYGDESSVSVEKLQENKRYDMLFNKSRVCLDAYGLSAVSESIIKRHYTAHCLPAQHYLRQFYLSPKSYFKDSGKKKLGACNQCASGLRSILLVNTTNPKPPTFSIANGLMIGPTPKCLEDLNDVEIAVISFARVDKHVFSIEGGSAQHMTGWHTMYANDLSRTSKTINWAIENEENGHNGVDEESDKDETNVREDREDDSSYDDREDEFEDDLSENCVRAEVENTDDGVESKPKFAQICVVLAGPMTPLQHSVALRKTSVDWLKMKCALEWLRDNNSIYANHDINDESLPRPIMLDETVRVASENTNIETVFEMNAVFPDKGNASTYNGGLKSKKKFKEITLERMMTEADDREGIMVNRPGTTILRDYEGENLVGAFPLQFPYGIGYDSFDGSKRSGVAYYKHLTLLSSKHFHRGDFCCVLHNMFERKRMVANSFLRHSDQQKASYCGITNEMMEAAFSRYNSKRPGFGIADVFLRKMDAVTSSMAHTHGAAKKARQNIYSMITKFGLPSFLFTLTPQDDVNFRIRVHFNNEEGEPIPPHDNAPLNVLRDYVVDCKNIRQKYPGLCALEYENMLKIAIEHFLGWDLKENANKKDEGLFGDIEAWTVATEEQGRRTLHFHMLGWVEGYKDLYTGLGQPNENERKKFEKKLQEYSNSVMCTSIFGKLSGISNRICKEDCVNYGKPLSELEKCNFQDIRNLRKKEGISSLGGKGILKCNCGKVVTNEDIALSEITKYIHPDRIADGGIKPTYNNGFWEKGQNLPNLRVLMEMKLLAANVRNRRRGRGNSEVRVEQYQTLMVGVLRNLHKTCHANKCFKQKGCECRMKIPSKPEHCSNVIFDNRKKDWFCWQGNNNPRKLYCMSAKRSHADLFTNVHNEWVSALTQSNNNVVACCDGGSPMYLSAYHSKNNQKEDSAKCGKAAKLMVSKMNEKLREAEEKGESSPDAGVDELTLGLKTMIGAVLISTDTHVVGAPMAAFLVRNQSRFQYSHEFAYTRISDFDKDLGHSFEITTDNDGTAFVKSHVANYIFRPKEWEKICMYDYVANFSAAKPSANSIKFLVGHPSADKLQCHKYKKKNKIPMINYLDFIDAKFFEGNNIIEEEITEDLDAKLNAMNIFAKKALICFLPFRNILDDLTIDGSFHRKLQEVVKNGELPVKLQELLQNLQDCRNSVNAGRPKDPLERITKDLNEKQTNSNAILDQMNEAEEALSSYVDLGTTFSALSFPSYRGARDELRIFSRDTTDFGSWRCGYTLCAAPILGEDGTKSVVCLPSTSSVAGDLLSSTVDKNLSYTPTLYQISQLQATRTVRRIGNGGPQNLPNATGLLANIREYANILFTGDKDQMQTFECIVASFVVKIYEIAECRNTESFDNRKKRRLDSNKRDLLNVNKSEQLIAFMSGAGGTGKSHVIKSVVMYCRELCHNIGIAFTPRTIVVTALTGAAAVSLRGETTDSALCLQQSTIKPTDIEKWEHTYMVIIDEVSFANRRKIETINNKLRELKEKDDEKFGGLDVIFAGDYSQLKPVMGNPIYLEDDFVIWEDWLHTFFELKTNHRFKKDKQWGVRLDRFRDNGPTKKDVELMNTRVVGKRKNQIPWKNVPTNIVYATKDNKDRMAVNDGIFVQHLKNSHSKNEMISPPAHTIVIKASNICWAKGGRLYEEAPRMSVDILYACVGDGHVRGRNDQKCYDPLLKLYYGRPIMINQNIDVRNCVANGTMCEFRGVVLKNGLTINDLQTMCIDDYYVRCVDADQLESISVRVLDGCGEDEEKVINLEAIPVTALAFYPVSIYGTINSGSDRIWRGMKMTQFPINCANARTIHKLQGRSLDNVLINCWDYTDNWVYVAISRVRTMSGLFIRLPLQAEKCKPMKAIVKAFLERLRKKLPKSPVILHSEKY